MSLIIDSSTNISLMLHLISLFNTASSHLSFQCCSLLLCFSVVAGNCCRLYTLVSELIRQAKHAEHATETTSHSRHVIETTDMI